VRWLPLFLSLFAILSVDCKQLSVDVSAPCSILINADTGGVLFEKNARQTSHPASITKIATALYALEKRGEFLDEIVTAQEDAIAVVSSIARKADFDKYPPYRLETGGTHIGLKVGERLPLRALLYGLMLNSGNDAANVIAQHVAGGDILQFMKDLNCYLKEKGITDTSFSNPSGLTHPYHYTTALDMAKIAQIAMQNPTFREIVRALRYIRPQTNKQPASVFVQHNRLLKQGALHYPKAIGIKTGFTNAAGYNIVAAAEKNGRTLIAVVLGADESVKRFKDAITLFEAGFNEKLMTRTLFSKQYDPFSTKIKGGASSLEAALAEDFKIAYYPSEEPEFQAFLNWHPVKLPVAKGQLVGEIQLKTPDGKVFKSASLFAAQDLDATLFTKVVGACGFLFRKQGIIVLLMLLVTTGAIVYCLRRTNQTAE
jgi:D-alanyl-D-alanine carboxypeptidase (penicillin-binding protein 5/6)